MLNSSHFSLQPCRCLVLLPLQSLRKLRTTVPTVRPSCSRLLDRRRRNPSSMPSNTIQVTFSDSRLSYSVPAKMTMSWTVWLQSTMRWGVLVLATSQLSMTARTRTPRSAAEETTHSLSSRSRKNQELLERRGCLGNFFHELWDQIGEDIQSVSDDENSHEEQRAQVTPLIKD